MFFFEQLNTFKKQISLSIRKYIALTISYNTGSAKLVSSSYIQTVVGRVNSSVKPYKIKTLIDKFSIVC